MNVCPLMSRIDEVPSGITGKIHYCVRDKCFLWTEGLYDDEHTCSIKFIAEALRRIAVKA
jgi:hypothetical protein